MFENDLYYIEMILAACLLATVYPDHKKVGK